MCQLSEKNHFRVSHLTFRSLESEVVETLLISGPALCEGSPHDLSPAALPSATLFGVRHPLLFKDPYQGKRAGQQEDQKSRLKSTIFWSKQKK